ncbi:hypothetical protein ACFQT0_30475 [Hymenobacter humi]|uniref:Uncharacterized protein n=1 Tax=Hymenobacter humi TaxID=1411620 RepID=A0ABW2UDI8_9BACT
MPAPACPGRSNGNGLRSPQGQSRTSFCQKKLQTEQVAPQAAKQQVSQEKLPPLDLALGADFGDLYFGLLFPAGQPTINPARGPDLARAQAFANHPNKAPPVRFS